VKVLDMLWNIQTDSIYLSPCTGTGNSLTFTKLLWSSTIFDPLGLITPITILISAKLFLQQLWQEHVGLDITLNNDLCVGWTEIADNIRGATTLSFPHQYAALLLTTQSVHAYLHVFTDTSLKAYRAVAYIQQDQALPSLVMSKSRATPLKLLILPKLELKVAVLAAKLSSFVKISLYLDYTVQL